MLFRSNDTATTEIYTQAYTLSLHDALPIPVIRQRGPSASCALLVEGSSDNIRFANVERALEQPDTAVRLFGKPEVRGHRRMGVSLALGSSIDAARAKARAMTQILLEGVHLD